MIPSRFANGDIALTSSALRQNNNATEERSGDGSDLSDRRFGAMILSAA